MPTPSEPRATARARPRWPATLQRNTDGEASGARHPSYIECSRHCDTAARTMYRCPAPEGSPGGSGGGLAMRTPGRLGTTVLGVYLIAVGVVPYVLPTAV